MRTEFKKMRTMFKKMRTVFKKMRTVFKKMWTLAGVRILVPGPHIQLDPNVVEKGQLQNERLWVKQNGPSELNWTFYLVKVGGLLK